MLVIAHPDPDDPYRKHQLSVEVQMDRYADEMLLAEMDGVFLAEGETNFWTEEHP